MIIFFIVIIVIFFLSLLIGNVDTSRTSNHNGTMSNLDNTLQNIVCIEKIEEHARQMQIEENINREESIYFSITSLIMFLKSYPNSKLYINKVKEIVRNNYPQILDMPIIKNISLNNFDFVEHIAYNAKIIQRKEYKDRNEAIYLTICMVYDDLLQRNSKKGIDELMTVVKCIYPDLLNEIITYVAWKYNPTMKFKPEFDKYMRKRHL